MKILELKTELIYDVVLVSTPKKERLKFKDTLYLIEFEGGWGWMPSDHITHEENYDNIWFRETSKEKKYYWLTESEVKIICEKKYDRKKLSF